MSLVKPAGKVTWVPSISSDATLTRIYWSTDGTDVTYDSPSEDFAIAVTEAELPFPSMGPVSDTIIKMGFASVDDVGNISDIVQIEVPLDVVAPDAPTGCVFVAA